MALLVDNIQKTWQSLGASQKVTIILSTVASLAIVGALTWYGGRPEWRTLTTGGDSRQVAEILGALDSVKIEHRLEGADVVLVRADQLQQARQEVIKKGLNSDGVGFELLDKTNAFTTSLLEQVNVQRAFMGELEKMIEAWPGVGEARVLIASEKESWRGNDKTGTASVNIRMKRGYILGQGDVSGIQSLVAGAWSTLKPERVTVVVDGKKLTRDPGEGDQAIFAAANEQLSTQREYEMALVKNAQTALDAALGSGKAIVTVHAELDFDSQVETMNIADPEAKLVTSESTTKTKKSGGKPTGGGAAGTSSNLPGASANAQNAQTPADETETSDTTETKYEYPKTQKTVKKNGFSVKKLSVALLADSSLKDRATELEGIVKASVGFETVRGDVYSGSASTEFPKPPDPLTSLPPAPTVDFNRLIADGGRAAVLLGLVVLFLFIVKRGGRAPAERRSAATGEGGEQDVTLVPQRGGAGVPPGSPAIGGMPAGAAAYAGTAAALPGAPDLGVDDRSPEQAARVALARNAAAAALRDPGVAGNVVRTWLEAKQ